MKDLGREEDDARQKSGSTQRCGKPENHIKTSEDFTKTCSSQVLTEELSKILEWKINTQISIVFLHTENTQSKIKHGVIRI